MSTLDDLLASAGPKSAFNRESPFGASVTGVVLDVVIRQAADFETKEPLFFPNGDPQENIVVSIKAEGITPESPEDDLHRSIWIKGWGLNLKAFSAAVADAGGKPEPGDRFTATYVREQASSRGGFPAKVYEYKLTKMADTQPAIKAEVDSARAQAQKLLSMGTFTDEQVAAATGLPAAEVQALSMQTPF